jgi:hypothetical protein
MKTEFPLTEEEEADFEALGGFEVCMEVVDKVLHENGIQRSLYTEEERAHIRRGRNPRSVLEFSLDLTKSLTANIDDLLRQAEEVQKDAGGTTYVGAMIQHLVGAKLDMVLGQGKIEHHGFSVADHSTARCGDYQVEGLVIHVTTHPTEALARKCADNLQAGLKPLIITIGDGLAAARLQLKELNLADRVDLLDVVQFLTANVYEHSSFQTAECKETLTRILNRYNTIVSECETDPLLRVRVGSIG